MVMLLCTTAMLYDTTVEGDPRWFVTPYLEFFGFCLRCFQTAELLLKRVNRCTGHRNQGFKHFIHRSCSIVMISFNFYGRSRIEIVIYNFFEV